jgi:hypothetical protein
MTLIVSTRVEARCQQEALRSGPGPFPEFPLRDNSNVAGCYEDPTTDRSLSHVSKLQPLPSGTKNGHGSIASIAIAIFQSEWNARNEVRAC